LNAHLESLGAEVLPRQHQSSVPNVGLAPTVWREVLKLPSLV